MRDLDWSQRSRNWNRQQLRTYVLLIVDYLLDDIEKTDPKKGQESTYLKSHKAWSALAHISELTKTLAGWAIHHQTGLAQHGLKHFSIAYEQDEDANPIFEKSRNQSDEHEIELMGSDEIEDPSPALSREILINCLGTNPAGLPDELHRQLIEALKALEFGETLPLFKSNVANRKVKWKQLQYQLRALTFIKFREERGLKTERAEKEVAEAFGIASDTFRTWKTRLRRDIGEISVAASLAGARNAAIIAEEATQNGDSKLVKISERRYGKQALFDAGAEYQNHLYQIKNGG